MAGNHHDPRLFFSVDNIRAFHIQNGEETDLTPSGPQTLSLLMVPTTGPTPSPTGSPSSTSQPAEEDFYLHLHLPPEVELPLPATTQIFHQPPRSYLIPRWDLGPDAGAFTRIEFPPIDHGPGCVSQDDIDTFETILAQCTAFLERAPPPSRHQAYNPATFGQEYGMGSMKPHGGQPGQIVLVDEENGSVVGELGEGFNVVESSDVKHGSKTPVAIQLPEEGGPNQINVSTVTPEYLQTASHPAYAKSSLVQSSATASRLLVTTSTAIGNALLAGADTFTKKTKANPKPMTFTPATQERLRKIHSFTTSAAGVSAKTVHQLSKYAQNFGAGLTGKDKDKAPKLDRNGNPKVSKPGILNKSFIAISTLGDAVDESARTLLRTGTMAATTVVGHRYGAEAGNMTAEFAGGAKNVGLVYIDAMGVSRRAVLKSVAKGMVVGRMKDGKQLVVGAGDGGQLPPDMTPHGKQASPSSLSNPYAAGPNSRGPPYPRRPSPSPTPPPPYGSQSGMSLGGTTMQGLKR